MEVQNLHSILPTLSTKDSNLPNGLQPNGLPERVELSRLEKSVEMAAQGLTIGAAVRQDEVRAALLIRTEVKYCATAFCAAPNTESTTIDECAATILAHYPHFNVAEIREAFRMASIGDLDVNMNAYYGLFSVRIVGDILSAYSDHRTQVVRQVRARMQAEQDAAENEQRAEMLKEKFGTIADQFAALQAKNDRYSRWGDLPGWFCERVIKEDVGGFSLEEKGKAWVTAKHWAVNQLGGWRLDPNRSQADRKRFNDAYAAIQADPECFPDELKPEAQEAYSKMLVYSKIATYETV